MRHSLEPSPTQSAFFFPNKLTKFNDLAVGKITINIFQFDTLKAGDCIFELQYFTIFWGSMPPDPPSFEFYGPSICHSCLLQILLRTLAEGQEEEKAVALMARHKN